MALADQKPATDAAPASGGILPCQAIERLIADGALKLAQPAIEGQIQPASLDLRLGETAYRVRAGRAHPRVIDLSGRRGNQASP